MLGTLTEPECDAIEREYFAQEDALDRVTAAEDDLIDDYLSSGLSVEEREQFERHYLSTPCHRRRVAVARAIRASASARSPEDGRRSTAGWPRQRLRPLWCCVAGGTWMLRSALPVRSTGDREPTTADHGGRRRRSRQQASQTPANLRRQIGPRRRPPSLRHRLSSQYRSRRSSSAGPTRHRLCPSNQEQTSSG